MSIAGGVALALDRGASIGCTAIQIFTKSSNQWFAKPLTSDDISSFAEKRKKTGIDCVIAHDSYLINLGSPKPDLSEKSFQAFADELERCDKLGLRALVFHPGAHVGDGEASALRRIGESLKRLLAMQAAGTVELLLETTAGQGSNVGYKFEQLAEMIEMAGGSPRLGVCFDTCHVLAAGYDFRTPQKYNEVMKEFDSVVGLDKIKAFHLNDSKKDLGCRVDRHEHIGKGFVGLEAFRLLLNDEQFQNVPKVLETPKEDDLKEDVENLELLRSLMA